jgi:hypothetical protein
MQIACPLCGLPNDLDYRSAGKTVRCDACQKSFVAPQELAVTGQHHMLQPFPVASLVLLHYVTAGLFSIIYLNLLHERIPRLRKDDPSATVAVGLCFVPLFNVYWFFFSYHRLCVRINEQRRFAGMAETAPAWLSVPVCALLACGMLTPFFQAAGLVFLGTLGLIVMPLFAGLVQNSINTLCDQEPAGAPAVG